MMLAFIAFGLLAPSELSPPLSVEARQEAAAFGGCIADRSAELAARTLNSDFTSASYKNAMKRLSETNRDCFKKKWMSSSPLLIAGGMAERLIEKDGAAINARLARAAGGQTPTTYSPTDKVAMCVVRSVPDQVGALFATDVGSAEEETAVAAFGPAVTLCAQNGPTVQATPAGLRAMLATAAFRSIATSAETSN